ncbi:WYL domain-containing protein [Actinoallomurus iriomotensis]|uniref:WYL domain-containing protein n=1 Tax=Actinoallomurus iriomotensis TaxID=478107 RepID=UPI002553FFC9|nr:WYL domain-containing protein [Actinoallomurus iriomotensis]
MAGACRDHERLRFDYRTHSGTAGRRSVEPHRPVHDRRRWYLVTWDVDRDARRTFRARYRPTRRSRHESRAVSARRPGDTGHG